MLKIKKIYITFAILICFSLGFCIGVLVKSNAIEENASDFAKNAPQGNYTLQPN